MTESEQLPPLNKVIWKAENARAGFSETEGVVSDVNLEIKAGERVAFLGHENSGRGLMLRLLAGLRPLKDGKLHILGFDMKPLPFWADWDEILPNNIRRKMGVCLEREGLLSNVSAREGLELLFRFKHGDHNVKLREGAQKVVNQLCARFGVLDVIEKRPNALTSAERRLVGLARAFLSKPSVLLLENPSENVGNMSRKRVWSALEEITSQPERTLLLSTDDWPIAHNFCPRWVVMRGGKIIYDGDSEAFLKQDDELAVQIWGLLSRNRIVEELSRKAV